jgi:hypothetical protein
MIRQAQTFVVATLFLLGMNLFFISQGLAMGTDKEYASSIPFDTASVYFEQNATDGDVEVVFKVSGGDVGLARLIVVSPDVRTVIDFSAPDTSTLGIRKFLFESPEPGNVESLKSAYPDGDQGTNIKDLKITWTPVRNLAAYIIEIEQEEMEVKFEARLPGDMATLAVPESFLLPGTEYKLSIGTVTDEGNMSFVETLFMTAGKE